MIVNTKYGKMRGVKEGASFVFKGVPFAKPPVGDLRFSPPQELDSWDGIFEADTWGNRCVQMGQQPGSFYEKEFYADPAFVPPSSEDCLYLNIWVPEGAVGDITEDAAEGAAEGAAEDAAEDAAENATNGTTSGAANKKLPVAFWIHGGAFLGGFGSELEFDGQALNKQGVILVTTNYRCGVFGFFSSEELSKEQGGSSGNYGILDQIAALRWVNENIGSFGGDPENVTIFGQSAGAMSVQTLVSSPLTRGMVNRAIMQSAGGYKTGVNRDRTQEKAEAEGESLMADLGISSLEEMRSMAAEDLLMKSMQFAFGGFQDGGTPGLMFTPVLDNVVLVDTYEGTVEKGLTPDIQYMLGSTKNDLTVTPELLEKDEKSPLYNGCIGWSLEQQKLGRNPSYVYYFTRDLPGDDAGAFHSAELWYVFGTLDRCWRPLTAEDHELSERITSYWTNFMKSGHPNADNLPEWKPCTTDDQNVLVLDI